jgi:arylsulfatase A-like enzyme
VTTLEDRLADDALTLPEILREAGYRTAAFSTNWHVTEATGMAQGFDDFIFLPEAVHSETVARRVVRWLGDRSGVGDRAGKPFFLYVHTLDPHAPYEPPADLRRRFAPEAPPDAGSRAYLERIYAATGSERAAERAELMAPVPSLYDAEVAAADRGFGALLDALRTRGLYDDTVIVFLADHGEELGEHGHLGHGYDLYRETLHIPWIVRLPGGTRPGGRSRVAARIQQTDLLPTLLGTVGVPPPAGLPGIDVLSGSPVPGRPAFSHLDYEGRRAMSVALGPWAAIEPLSAAFGRWPELYATDRDPNELVDLGGWDPREPVRLGSLRTLIRRHLLGPDGARDGSLAETTEIDPATRRGLEALGYL